MECKSNVYDCKKQIKLLKNYTFAVFFCIFILCDLIYVNKKVILTVLVTICKQNDCFAFILCF